MSLILDALRRADSEREREHGAVPGLHAQQIAVAPLPGHAGVPPWAWIAIVAAAGLLVALGAWLIARGGVAQQIAVPAVAQPPLTAPPAAAAPAAPSASMAAATPPATAVTASAPPVAAAPAQPVAEPAPWPAPDSARKAGTEAVPAAPKPAPEVRTLTAASVAPAEARITPREQLPENIRTQLPPLKVDGSIYSASAPDRSVIIDGRILRENDRLAADLTLEQIRPKSAVLRFKGYRFEIAF